MLSALDHLCVELNLQDLLVLRIRLGELRQIVRVSVDQVYKKELSAEFSAADKSAS